MVKYDSKIHGIHNWISDFSLMMNNKSIVYEYFINGDSETINYVINSYKDGFLVNTNITTFKTKTLEVLEFILKNGDIVWKLNNQDEIFNLVKKIVEND